MEGDNIDSFDLPHNLSSLLLATVGFVFGCAGCCRSLRSGGGAVLAGNRLLLGHHLQIQEGALGSLVVSGVQVGPESIAHGHRHAGDLDQTHHPSAFDGLIQLDIGDGKLLLLCQILQELDVVGTSHRSHCPAVKRLHDRVLVDGQVSKELPDLFALLAVQSVDALGFVVRVGPRLQLATAVDHGQGALSQLLQFLVHLCGRLSFGLFLGSALSREGQRPHPDPDGEDPLMGLSSHVHHVVDRHGQALGHAKLLQHAYLVAHLRGATSWLLPVLRRLSAVLGGFAIGGTLPAGAGGATSSGLASLASRRSPSVQDVQHGLSCRLLGLLLGLTIARGCNVTHRHLEGERWTVGGAVRVEELVVWDDPARLEPLLESSDRVRLVLGHVAGTLLLLLQHLLVVALLGAVVVVVGVVVSSSSLVTAASALLLLLVVVIRLDQDVGA